MAFNCWRNGFDNGQDMWQEALPHFGCAFEASEIMMTTMALEPQYACEMFTSAAKLLAETFAKLGDIEQSMEVYWLAINRLERELSYRPQENQWVLNYLTELYQFVQTTGHSAPVLDRPQSTYH